MPYLRSHVRRLLSETPVARAAAFTEYLIVHKRKSFAQIVQHPLTTAAKAMHNAVEELEQLLQQKEVYNA
jgi:hypothetical protein